MGYYLASSAGNPRHDTAWYLHQASLITENFSEAYTFDQIPRDDVAQALAYYLRAIQEDPSNKDGYRGAIWCYAIVGSQQEIKKLELQAKEFGLDVDELRDSQEIAEILRAGSDSEVISRLQPNRVAGRSVSRSLRLTNLSSVSAFLTKWKLRIVRLHRHL